MKELLISVTNFFRDPAAYEALEQRVIRGMFQEQAGARSGAGLGGRVRDRRGGVFGGDAAGRMRERHGSTPPRIQVFATDLDEQAIAVAREGFYTDAEVADVSHERLQRFFRRERRLSRPPRAARAGAVRASTTSSRIRRSRTSI